MVNPNLGLSRQVPGWQETYPDVSDFSPCMLTMAAAMLTFHAAPWHLDAVAEKSSGAKLRAGPVATGAVNAGFTAHQRQAESPDLPRGV